MPDLDHGNRFFDDNRYLAHKYGSGYIAIEKEQEEPAPPTEVVVEAPKPIREVKHVEPAQIPRKQFPPTREDEKLARRRELYREHDPTLQHTSHIVTPLMDLPSEQHRYTTAYRTGFTQPADKPASENVIAGVATRTLGARPSSKMTFKQMQR